jgi:5-formyltetrahydrofolate cyclo-ligase
MQNKSDLRRRMLALRQGIAGDDRVRLERSILERILALPSYLGAERVALYIPIREK